jgi:hypothetical protein
MACVCPFLLARSNAVLPDYRWGSEGEGAEVEAAAAEGAGGGLRAARRGGAAPTQGPSPQAPPPPLAPKPPYASLLGPLRLRAPCP